MAIRRTIRPGKTRLSFVSIDIAVKLAGLSWREYKPQAAELQNREVRVEPLGCLSEDKLKLEL
jgi:hypothetical protein